MKTFFFLSVFFVPTLLTVIADKPISRFVINPRVKHSLSNGDDTYLPADNSFSETLHHRAARRPSTCRFPENLKDSQLNCTLYPSKIKCLQTCMFGYTFSEGKQRLMKCKFDDDKWSPVPEFEKCKPFVDCGLTLGPGGSYNCRKNFMYKGASCKVSCSHYEDKEAVPPAVYECNIDGKWTPPLPFCARAGSGLKLVSPPRG